MSSLCPCDVNFRYSFFSRDFSTQRKVAGGTAIAIGAALAIIFALGIAGVIPGINAQYPILGLTFGTIAFLVTGFVVSGCKPKNTPYEIADISGGLSSAIPPWQIQPVKLSPKSKDSQ